MSPDRVESHHDFSHAVWNIALYAVRVHFVAIPRQETPGGSFKSKALHVLNRTNRSVGSWDPFRKPKSELAWLAWHANPTMQNPARQVASVDVDLEGRSSEHIGGSDAGPCHLHEP